LLISTSGGATNDALFFEPTYQGGSYSGDTVPDQCPGNEIPCAILNTWQTWDAASGGWWSDNDNTGGPPLHTLAGYAALHPGATLATDAPSLRINAGFGAGAWDNYDGNFDNVTVMSDNYDFEAPLPACTTDCYVRTDGNDLNSGSADTASDAKLTIQAAVNQVSSGGTVHVAAGTYTENVTVSTPLT